MRALLCGNSNSTATHLTGGREFAERERTLEQIEAHGQWLATEQSRLQEDIAAKRVRLQEAHQETRRLESLEARRSAEHRKAAQREQERMSEEQVRHLRTNDEF